MVEGGDGGGNSVGGLGTCSGDGHRSKADDKGECLGNDDLHAWDRDVLKKPAQ